VLGLQVVVAVVWPALAFRRFGYEVRAGDLLVEQGVLFRHRVSIPLDRIQHADTRQGPIERAWGLSRLVVYTAAGLNADGSIPGLDEAEADRLRDRLTLRRGDGGI
jgi:membrane protein YdbS with pleckstrin-like domain